MHARLSLLVLFAACSTTKESPRPASSKSTALSATAADARAESADVSTSAAPADARCPEGMVYIPGGQFIMGLSEGGQRDLFESLGSTAPHPVTLTKPYCIDKTEVTARSYHTCIAAGGCPASANQCNGGFEDRLDHPANCMRWAEAEAYCKWAGNRLPTEAEWEFAARGPESFRHPWGNSKPDDSKLWYSGTTKRGFTTAPVGSHPAGASPFGLLDMAGNVSEFVADWYSRHPKEAQTDPVGPPSGRSKVLKGSALDSGALYEDDLGDRFSINPNMEGSFAAGFRCAK